MLLRNEVVLIASDCQMLLRNEVDEVKFNMATSKNIKSNYRLIKKLIVRLLDDDDTTSTPSQELWSSEK